MTRQGPECNREASGYLCVGSPPWSGVYRPIHGLLILPQVERNMRLRRKRLLGVLRPGEEAPSMTCFPSWCRRLHGRTTRPRLSRTGICSLFGPRFVERARFHRKFGVSPNEVVSPHPRHRSLARNIRVRGLEISLTTYQRFRLQSYIFGARECTRGAFVLTLVIGFSCGRLCLRDMPWSHASRFNENVAEAPVSTGRRKRSGRWTKTNDQGVIILSRNSCKTL